MIAVRRRGTRGAAGILAAGVVLLLTGCVGLPVEGPVVEATSAEDSGRIGGYNYDPLPPQSGAAPSEIVEGFLDAMMAAPIQTSSARQFLTKEAQTSWTPEASTITYADRESPVGSNPVSVALPGSGDVFDDRGVWQEELDEDNQTVQFEMAVEDSEWRIAKAPNALIVSEQFFEQRFRRAALYFFDPTARIMVPEPVFVPVGDQLASSLVSGLLDGPGAPLARVARSFVPGGLSAGLSVPVSAEGVADLTLSGDVQRPTADALRLMVTQVAWTLRQVPEIKAFRLTLGEELLQLPGGETEFQVGTGAEYNPAGPQVNGSLFGLRAGSGVFGTPDDLAPVGAPFGDQGWGLRTFATDLAASQAAGVTEDGTELLLAPLFGAAEAVPDQLLSGRSDLLEPLWDAADRLWVVDRTSAGAEVLVRTGGAFREITVDGVSGEQVRSVLVSRDGSRLVAVVRGNGRDDIVVSRLEYNEQGQPLRGTRPVVLRRGVDGSPRVRDIAWSDPVTVATLTRMGGDYWEVSLISVDGSRVGSDNVATINDRVRGLAGSPVESQSLLVHTADAMVDLGGSIPAPIPLDADVTDLDYVG